ncbi:MAG: nucleotidyl transferase AbiEii/AbiGii toxin family protein [Patescibacteria group bacterium]
MTKILFDIYSEPTLRQELGFKGGTAAYLFYNLPRFSTDLDFDFLSQGDNQKIFDQVKSIAAKYGEIKDEMIKKNTIYFRLSYRSGDHNIKIEISKRTNLGNTYNIQEYYGLPILVMDKDCLAANKLVAIFDRKKMVNRDWFDCWFFLNNDWPIKKEIIESRTGLKFPEYFRKLAIYLEKNKSRLNILQGLGEVLDAKQKSYVKNKMISDLIFHLKLYSDKPELFDRNN